MRSHNMCFNEGISIKEKKNVINGSSIEIRPTRGKSIVCLELTLNCMS